MINKLKNFVKKNINKLKYLQANKWIEENKIDMLGKCFKYEKENKNIFIRLVAVNNERKMFTGLVIEIPKEINSCESEVLVTDKYGPYNTIGVPYKDLGIYFVDDLEVSKVENNLSYEIPTSEFTEKLTYAMDKFLAIGY